MNFYTGTLTKVTQKSYPNGGGYIEFEVDNEPTVTRNGQRRSFLLFKANSPLSRVIENICLGTKICVLFQSNANEGSTGKVFLTNDAKDVFVTYNLGIKESVTLPHQQKQSQARTFETNDCPPDLEQSPF